MRILAGLAAVALAFAAAASEGRPRLREFGLKTGVLETGPLNAITDVAGVLVGQVTLIEGKDVRTGVTAILPTGETSSWKRSRARSRSPTASASSWAAPRSRNSGRSKPRSS